MFTLSVFYSKIFFFLVSVRKLRCHRDGELIVTEKFATHKASVENVYSTFSDCSNEEKAFWKEKYWSRNIWVGCVGARKRVGVCEENFAASFSGMKSFYEKLKTFSSFSDGNSWIFLLCFPLRETLKAHNSPHRYERARKTLQNYQHKLTNSIVEQREGEKKNITKHLGRKIHEGSMNRRLFHFIFQITFSKQQKRFTQLPSSRCCFAARMCYWLKFARFGLFRSFHNC